MDTTPASHTNQLANKADASCLSLSLFLFSAPLCLPIKYERQNKRKWPSSWPSAHSFSSCSSLPPSSSHDTDRWHTITIVIVPPAAACSMTLASPAQASSSARSGYIAIVGWGRGQCSRSISCGTPHRIIARSLTLVARQYSCRCSCSRL